MFGLAVRGEDEDGGSQSTIAVALQELEAVLLAEMDVQQHDVPGRGKPVAAIVSLAGATVANPAYCAPVSPVAVLEILGTADDAIAFTGGTIEGLSRDLARTSPTGAWPTGARPRFAPGSTTTSATCLPARPSAGSAATMCRCRDHVDPGGRLSARPGCRRNDPSLTVLA